MEGERNRPTRYEQGMCMNNVWKVWTWTQPETKTQTGTPRKT